MDDQQARQRVRSAASAHRQSRRQFRASRWLLSGAAPARGRCGVPPHPRRTALHRCWSSRAATGTPVWPAVLARTTTKRGSSRFKRARSWAREFSSRQIARYPCAPSPLLSQCPCGRPHGGHGTPATMRSSEAARQDMYRGCDGVHQRLVCRVPESAVIVPWGPWPMSNGHITAPHDGFFCCRHTVQVQSFPPCRLPLSHMLEVGGARACVCASVPGPTDGGFGRDALTCEWIQLAAASPSPAQPGAAPGQQRLGTPTGGQVPQIPYPTVII